MNTPGQTPQTRALATSRAFLATVPRRVWLGYGALVLVATALQVIVSRFSRLGWFMAGVVISGAVVDFVHRLRMIDGSDSWRKGALAEQWTAEELKRRKNWAVFHGLMMGPGDIDHVAVSQDGVFVLETKFTTHKWRLEGAALRGAVGDHLASVARRAWRVTGHLRRTGVTEVTPVLVVWGAQPDGSPPIQQAGNVTVVWARNADWVFLLEGGALSAETAAAATAELRSFQDGQLAFGGPVQAEIASGG